MNSREIESWGMKEIWLHKRGDRYKQRSDMKVGGESGEKTKDVQREKKEIW